MIAQHDAAKHVSAKAFRRDSLGLVCGEMTRVCLNTYPIREGEGSTGGECRTCTETPKPW